MLFMYLCFIGGAGDSKERAGAVLEPPQIFIPTFLHLVTQAAAAQMSMASQVQWSRFNC